MDRIETIENLKAKHKESIAEKYLGIEWETMENLKAKHMESIAEKYLGIEWETIENLKAKHRGNVEPINRDIVRKWSFMNPGEEP